MVLLQRKLHFVHGSRGGPTYSREGVQLFPGDPNAYFYSSFYRDVLPVL